MMMWEVAESFREPGIRQHEVIGCRSSVVGPRLPERRLWVGKAGVVFGRRRVTAELAVGRDRLPTAGQRQPSITPARPTRV
jgi:hypothetical protein